MRLAEEILLLDRSDEGMLSRAPEWLIRYALGGAVLMDLALENRIDTDVDRLFLIDSAPVGDALLDPVLAEIAGSSGSHDALFWVEHATRHADEIRETALLRLVDNGILVVHDDRYLRIFGTQRYMLVRKETERELTGRIRAALMSSAIPDPKDVLIVTLADGCGLLDDVLPADEMDQAVARIALLRKMDLIGRAFLDALELVVQPAARKLDRRQSGPPLANTPSETRSRRRLFPGR